MAAQKTTTMIYKHLNFKNNSSGMSALFKSLAHSLRIAPTVKNKILATKILEWDDERSHLNYVWTSDLGNAPVKLNTLSEKQKVVIQENFIAPIIDEQKTKDEKSDLLDTLSKYKAKINKWHNSITGDDSLKSFLAQILNEKNFVDIDATTDQLGRIEFARKNQKIESVRKFLELHNKVVENKSDLSRNKIFVQEAFFKIPSHNNVNVSAADLISNIRSFYKNNFPDYPIKLIVFHGDEIGNHPHIFVDAKNRRTGKYDLLSAQNNFVNYNIEKLKDEYPDAKVLDFSKRDYSDKKRQAQYFQTLFYQHSNKMLAKYDVEAKKLERTVENNARIALIEADSKKPKIQRQFSYYNAETIRFREEYELALLNASNAVGEKDIAVNELNKKNVELSSVQSQLLVAQKEFKKLTHDLPALRSEKNNLTIDIPNLKKEQTELQRKNDELLSKALQYDEISEAYEEIETKYGKICDDYKIIVDRAKKQISVGIREFCSVMWGIIDWSGGRFSFSALNPFVKNKMKGAPKDLQEFDERVERLTRMAVDETIDNFLEMDFLIPKTPIAQAFKSKVIDERNKPERHERRDFLGEGVDLNYPVEPVYAPSKVKIPTDTKAGKLFDEAEMDEKIKETQRLIKLKKK